MAELVVTTKGIRASHPLPDSWVTVGRSDDNMFQIVEDSVSSRHCEVRLRNDELTVRDLQSTNGTFIGGKKISEGVLKPGQTLRLGEVELRLELGIPAMKSIPTVPVVDYKPEKPPGAVAEPEVEPAKRFHVLFVDDSMAFLETFGELCSVLSKKTWDIHLATTADRALAELQTNPCDLVVLDIGMPMVDGLQLLGIIRHRYPGVKIVVMTGNPSDARRTDALARGAELFMEKPVSADGSKLAFNMMNDLMSWVHREGFTGALRQVGLPDVIQMECIARHSSILEVRNAQMHGQIYIEGGVITHAAVGSLVGDKAVYRLLSMAGGEFQVKPFKSPPERTVHVGWEHLVMEAARVSDEETAFLKRPPPPSQPPAVTLPPPSNPAPPPPNPSEGKEGPTAGAKSYSVLGENIVEIATYDEGKWRPVDGSKEK